MTIYSPPVNTYTPIGSFVLGANAASVTLTGFSQEYRDLVLIIDGEISNYDYILLRYNGDLSASYPYTDIIGDGSGTYTNSGTLTGARVGRISTLQNSNAIIQIMDYSTAKHKTTLARSASPNEMAMAIASRWTNTSAITSITALTLSGLNFETNTTFNLFGIKA